MNFIQCKNKRINLDYIVAYIFSDVYIEVHSINKEIFKLRFDSKEEVQKIINFLDNYFKVKVVD